ncbi:hypothetical protein FXO37_21415 [Capsicum annuum]|nr:hypothetical protein FXO37_21415 [Capsicum annuum]
MSVRLMKKILEEQQPAEPKQLIDSEDESESESPPPSSATFRNPFDLLDDEDYTVDQIGNFSNYNQPKSYKIPHRMVDTKYPYAKVAEDKVVEDSKWQPNILESKRHEDKVVEDSKWQPNILESKRQEGSTSASSDYSKGLLGRCVIGSFSDFTDELPTLSEVRKWAFVIWKKVFGINIYEMVGSSFLFEFPNRNMAGRSFLWEPNQCPMEFGILFWRSVRRNCQGGNHNTCPWFRLNLITAVLDALPTYMLSLFPIPSEITQRVISQRLDKIRKTFLWQENKEKNELFTQSNGKISP